MARRSTSASSRPTAIVCATERTSPPGSRPISRHAASTRANWAATASILTKGTLVSVAKRAARAGVRFAPWPPTITGGGGGGARFGGGGGGTGGGGGPREGETPPR